MSSDSSFIVTERLSLRPPQLADAESIFNGYANDCDVTRYLGWPRHTELSETQAFIEFSIEKWDRDQIGPYLILDKITDRIIGGTGLELSEEKNSFIVGRTLGRMLLDLLKKLLELGLLLLQENGIIV